MLLLYNIMIFMIEIIWQIHDNIIKFNNNFISFWFLFYLFLK